MLGCSHLSGGVMRFRSVHGLAVTLASVLWCSPLAAQAMDDLPTVKTLNCGKDCQRATDPKALDGHQANFPGLKPSDYPTEGLVVLQATVTKDGVLKDQRVTGLIGIQVFADKALESSKDWHYQPATRNGVPVDRANWQILVTFFYRPAVTGARDEIYRDFREINELSGQGKYADAIARLLPILSMPHLNLYEREAVFLQLAIGYGHQGDILTAREYLDDVTLIGEKYLSKSLRPTLWRMAFITNAQTGQILEAKEAFEKLNAVQPVAADDPLAKSMQSVDVRMRESTILTATGRIAKTSLLQSWKHKLVRHNFAIQKVDGKLDRLEVGCGERLTESAFSDKAEWHIPKNWDKCELIAHGDPGTTFTLAEMEE